MATVFVVHLADFPEKLAVLNDVVPEFVERSQNRPLGAGEVSQRVQVYVVEACANVDACGYPQTGPE